MYNFSEATINKIVSMYNDGKSTVEIAKEFGCSNSTILRVLKAKGINISGNRLQLKESDINKIISMYNEGKYSSIKIAREFGCNCDAILEVLRDNGINIRGNRLQLKESAKNKIISMYTEGKSSGEIAEECGCSYPTILKVLRDKGIDIIVNRLQLRESDINKIISLYNEGKSSREIVEEFLTY